jgi:hypothetical protein
VGFPHASVGHAGRRGPTDDLTITGTGMSLEYNVEFITQSGLKRGSDRSSLGNLPASRSALRSASRARLGAKREPAYDLPEAMAKLQDAGQAVVAA